MIEMYPLSRTSRGKVWLTRTNVFKGVCFLYVWITQAVAAAAHASTLGQTSSVHMWGICQFVFVCVFISIFVSHLYIHVSILGGIGIPPFIPHENE